MKNEMIVIIEICCIHKEWLCTFDTQELIVDNIKSFLKTIESEIQNEYIFSENLLLLEKQTHTLINPFIKVSNSGLYQGITILLC